MFVSIQHANSPLALLVPFDGDASRLQFDCSPCGDEYLACSSLECTGNRRLLLAVVPDDIIGGHRWRRRPLPETLLVLLLSECEQFTQYGRTAHVPARFFWHDARKQRLRQAPLFFASDNMRSVCLTAYSARGQRLLAVHRLLAWSFRCPLGLEGMEYSDEYDVHHVDENHGNNELANLFCWVAGGPEGHRAYSGWFGAQQRLLNLQNREQSVEEE